MKARAKRIEPQMCLEISLLLQLEAHRVPEIVGLAGAAWRGWRPGSAGLGVSMHGPWHSASWSAAMMKLEYCHEEHDYHRR